LAFNCFARSLSHREKQGFYQGIHFCSLSWGIYAIPGKLTTNQI
jgi:hypothetical protein